MACDKRDSLQTLADALLNKLSEKPHLELHVNKEWMAGILENIFIHNLSNCQILSLTGFNDEEILENAIDGWDKGFIIDKAGISISDMVEVINDKNPSEFLRDDADKIIRLAKDLESYR